MAEELQACPNCLGNWPRIETRRVSGVHYSDICCTGCGKHLGFGRKPDDDATKYKRPKSHAELVNKFSRGHCELCGFDKGNLPRGETLTAHHVARFSEGGEASRENTWIVCTACHSLIEHQRTYRGKLHRVVVADLEAIKAAMQQPPTGESLDALILRKRQEQSL